MKFGLRCDFVPRNATVAEARLHHAPNFAPQP